MFIEGSPHRQNCIIYCFQRMADGGPADLILTTGGAGCGRQDCTPEATMEVVDRPLLGIPEGYTSTHAYTDKRACVEFRAAAGIR